MSEKVLEINSELTSLEDCKDIKDFSFDKVELMRGKTPENIKKTCLDLCKNYLAGVWTEQTVDTIHVKRLSGGLTNQLYCCGLSDPSTAEGVPHEVVIRLYGPKHFNNGEGGNERLTDLIIALMVSESKLGPKIYGIFEEGQIQAYIKHRQFRCEEQQTPKLAEQLFRKLARVHAMEVPIKKTTNWVFEFLDTFYDKTFKKISISDMVKEMNLETFQKYDVKIEIEWLKKTITDIKSPVVFTHIDFRGSNIMVTEPNDEIILCDFEYSSYGYRGFDFGTIIVEWNRSFEEFFQQKNHVEKYPDDTKIKSLLKSYINESEKIFGKKYSDNKINSMDQLVKEVKVFSLVSDMFVILLLIKSDQDDGGFPIDKRLMMEMSERLYAGYIKLKEKFIQDKII